MSQPSISPLPCGCPPRSESVFTGFKDGEKSDDPPTAQPRMEYRLTNFLLENLTAQKTIERRFDVAVILLQGVVDRASEGFQVFPRVSTGCVLLVGDQTAPMLIGVGILSY